MFSSTFVLSRAVSGLSYDLFPLTLILTSVMLRCLHVFDFVVAGRWVVDGGRVYTAYIQRDIQRHPSQELLLSGGFDQTLRLWSPSAAV